MNTNSEELIYAVALNKVFRYNPRISNFLLRECGSAKAVFSLSDKYLKEKFCRRGSLLKDLSDKCILDWAEREISWANSKGIKLLYLFGNDYPKSLTECCDPPVILYLFGDVDLDTERIISIVGTRMSTRYGTESCRKIVGELKEYGLSPVIVSGLAYGVDIAAHKAALESGFKTVAVLPNGLDRIYPAAHYEIAKQISRQGAIITEFPRETESFKINFIQRNRLIAALSKATLVIESGERGGALSTAGLAQSYSREVFALPGKITDRFSAGCNNLIFHNIASIFCSTRDFTDSMGWISDNKRVESIQKELFYCSSPGKEKILVALRSNSELSIDELLHISGERLQIMSRDLLELELEGRIHSLAGKRYCLA